MVSSTQRRGGRSRTQTLAEAQRNGEHIVCADQPHRGREVSYQPRNTQDPFPWKVLPDGPRVSGGSCYIQQRQ